LTVSDDTALGGPLAASSTISNPHVTVKAEALYVVSANVASAGSTYLSHFKNTSVVGRLGVNLKW
jgi:hypothetical protein